MKFLGTIDKLNGTGEGVAFTITNCKQKGAAEWREYCGEITFRTTEAQARQFTIGRTVEITVTPKGKP